MTDRQALTDEALAAIETDLAFRLLQGKSREGLFRLTAEIRALRTERQQAEERERRLCVLVACLWDDGGCEGDIDHAAAYRWLGIPVPGSDEYGDAFERMVEEFAARGRAVVAEGKEGQG